MCRKQVGAVMLAVVVGCLFAFTDMVVAQDKVVCSRQQPLGGDDSWPTLAGDWNVRGPSLAELPFKAGSKYNIEVKGDGEPAVYIVYEAPKGTKGEVIYKTAGDTTAGSGMIILEKRTALKGSGSVSFPFTGRNIDRCFLFVGLPRDNSPNRVFQITVTELAATKSE